MAKQWAEKNGWSLDYTAQVLSELKLGIEETLDVSDME
jgi:hypothetical protein